MWNGFYTVDRTRWAPLGEDDCDQASVAAFGQCRVVRRYAIGDRHRAVIACSACPPSPTSSRSSRFANFSLTVKLCTAPRNRKPAQIAGLIRPLAGCRSLHSAAVSCCSSWVFFSSGIASSIARKRVRPSSYVQVSIPLLHSPHHGFKVPSANSAATCSRRGAATVVSAIVRL